MKKVFCIFIFWFFVLIIQAQQSVQYSQFILNEYALNPAVAGTIKDWRIMLCRRTQWRGFPLSPETHSLGVTKDIGKKAYKRYWHGIGMYFELDKSGQFSNAVGYGTYAIHLKLAHNYFFGFGLNVGIKRYTVKTLLLDANDPALVSRNGDILIYPDFIPGAYLHSRKFDLGISVRNLYKNSLQQGNKKIGTPSKLSPVAYITLSKKFLSPAYDFTFFPAIHIQSTFRTLPLINLNLMAYYRNRVGLGLAYRVHDAISLMIQIRLYDNLIIGFAYDYTISRFRAANANSTEFMMGYTPMGGADDTQVRSDVAACPKFDF